MGPIIGLYLAAGSGVRMGCDKLSLPLGDGTVGSQALRAACSSQLDEVLVLTKPHDPLIWLQGPAMEMDADACTKIHQVECPDASLGQSYTLRGGILAAESRRAEAVVVMLADQPFVPTTMIDQIIRTYRNGMREDPAARCVAASYRSIPRPPILFSQELFSVLKQLQGDTGAKTLFRDGRLTPVVIEYFTPEYFDDIDTPADYEPFVPLTSCSYALRTCLRSRR